MLTIIAVATIALALAPIIGSVFSDMLTAR